MRKEDNMQKEKEQEMTFEEIVNLRREIIRLMGGCGSEDHNLPEIRVIAGDATPEDVWGLGEIDGKAYFFTGRNSAFGFADVVTAYPARPGCTFVDASGGGFRVTEDLRVEYDPEVREGELDYDANSPLRTRIARDE